MSVMVSVVIPTYRRDGLLKRCLEKVLHQTLDPWRFEIIVADDGPSRSTRRLVESLAASVTAPLTRFGGGVGGKAGIPHRDSLDLSEAPEIRYIPVTATQGPAGARNAGWRAARGQIIAFTDDDCLPEHDWLRAGVEAMSQADAAVGRTIVPLPERPRDYERDTAGLAEAEFITANCFCRREVLEAVGGFDERFTSAWREDSDLQFSLLERGMHIARADKAVVVHPVRKAPWGVSLRLQRRGIFDPLLYRRHPELYRTHIPPLPRSYYLAIAELAGAAAGAITGQPWLAVLGFGAWLSTTARFAARRLRGTSMTASHVAEMTITSALIPPLSIYWRLRGLLRHRTFYV